MRPWSASFLIVVVAAGSLVGWSRARAESAPGARSSIDVAALSSALAVGGLKLVDVRSAEDYAQGHLPGARHLDRRRFDNPDQARDGEIAGPELMSALLGEVGLDPADEVVVYSGVQSLQMGTRLCWLLRGYGHARVRVLDGGFEAWAAAGRPVETGLPAAVAATTYPVQPFKAAWRVDADAVARRAAETVLLDVRTRDEYTGARVARGAGRGGHIPGAVHLYYQEAVGSDGLLRPAAELRALFASRGVTADKEVIVYCMRAHRASHTWFVLTELLGFERVRIYNGSWIEWSNHPDRPAVEGEAPQ